MARSIDDASRRKLAENLSILPQSGNRTTGSYVTSNFVKTKVATVQTAGSRSELALPDRDADARSENQIRNLARASRTGHSNHFPPVNDPSAAACHSQVHWFLSSWIRKRHRMLIPKNPVARDEAGPRCNYNVQNITMCKQLCVQIMRQRILKILSWTAISYRSDAYAPACPDSTVSRHPPFKLCHKVNRFFSIVCSYTHVPRTASDSGEAPLCGNLTNEPVVPFDPRFSASRDAILARRHSDEDGRSRGCQSGEA
ncbi:hypothetical protein OF83DRAFT_511083 [Amylostereum chailletii]|nr:hypothetical protein OF83DRAFT_511083 [Amylostereum chailletii]